MFEVGTVDLGVSVFVLPRLNLMQMVWVCFALHRFYMVLQIGAVDSGLLYLMFQSLILLQSLMETGTQSKSHHLNSLSIPPPPHLPVVEQITSPVGGYFPSEL